MREHSALQVMEVACVVWIVDGHVQEENGIKIAQRDGAATKQRMVTNVMRMVKYTHAGVVPPSVFVKAKVNGFGLDQVMIVALEEVVQRVRARETPVMSDHRTLKLMQIIR